MAILLEYEWRRRVVSLAADQSGAVTVDWVALTATVVVIGIGIAYSVFGGGSGEGVLSVVESFGVEVDQAATNIAGAVPTSLPGS